MCHRLRGHQRGRVVRNGVCGRRTVVSGDRVQHASTSSDRDVHSDKLVVHVQQHSAMLDGGTRQVLQVLQNEGEVFSTLERAFDMRSFASSVA